MGAVKAKGTKTAEKLLPVDEAESSLKPQSKKETGQASRLPKDVVAEASAIFKMAGDPIRLNLLLALAEGEHGVGDLCAQFGQSQPAISHHLALLRHSGLIQPRRLGKQNLYSLTDQGRHIANWLGEIVTFKQAPKRHRTKTTPIDPAILDDVSGFVDDAEGWFLSPNAAFEGRKPIELLGTAEEPRLRNRIEAAKLGMFS